MSESATIKVGSRDSQLAMIQTNIIIDALKEQNPDMKFEIVSMKTTGDKILNAALSKIGQKNLFTRELEIALQDNSVNFVVHSLKDLPTTVPDGLVVGCIFKRDSRYDAVVMHPKHKGKKLEELPNGSNIGTSALRRQAQLQRKFPNFTFESIRGNLNTRLRKLDEDDKYDAIILAEAGLLRMGWQDRVAQVLKMDDYYYAIGQGAMAVECREDDAKTIELLSTIYDCQAGKEVIAERSFMKTLEGGCSVPIGIIANYTDEELELRGGVFSLDGKDCVEDEVLQKMPSGEGAKKAKKSESMETYTGIVCGGGLTMEEATAANKAGKDLAKKLIEAGADIILKKARALTEASIIADKVAKEAIAAKEATEKATA